MSDTDFGEGLFEEAPFPARPTPPPREERRAPAEEARRETVQRRKDQEQVEPMQREDGPEREWEEDLPELEEAEETPKEAGAGREEPTEAEEPEDAGGRTAAGAPAWPREDRGRHGQEETGEGGDRGRRRRRRSRRRRRPEGEEGEPHGQEQERHEETEEREPGWVEAGEEDIGHQPSRPPREDRGEDRRREEHRGQRSGERRWDRDRDRDRGRGRERDRGRGRGGREDRPAPSPQTPAALGLLAEPAAGLLASQRLGVLLDLDSLLHAARGQQGARISFQKVARQLLRGRQVGRMIAYHSEHGPARKEAEEHIQHLAASGFEVHRVPASGDDRDGASRAACVAMAVDAMALAERCDAMVLLTHDPVMTVLARALAARGVRVEIAGIPDGMGEALRTTGNQLVPLGRECFFTP